MKTPGDTGQRGIAIDQLDTDLTTGFAEAF